MAAQPRCKLQAAVNFRFHFFTVLRRQPIPFVYHHHHGTPCIHHMPEQAHVLLGNTFCGIHHLQHHVRFLNGLQRFYHRKLFHGFIHFATTDRKSTRLNSSHVSSSYAVFCLEKKIH